MNNGIILVILLYVYAKRCISSTNVNVYNININNKGGG